MNIAMWIARAGINSRWDAKSQNNMEVKLVWQSVVKRRYLVDRNDIQSGIGTRQIRRSEAAILNPSNAEGSKKTYGCRSE